jgi:hypothetical protein
VRGRTYLELGKAADLAGNRAGALAEYAKATKASTTAGDADAVAAARRFTASPYRGV